MTMQIDHAQLERMVTEAEIVLQRRLREQKLAEYRPYPKQLEFHHIGRQKKKRERLFRAGNQLGKTVSGGAEAVYHLTGLYPDWWQGRRLEQACRGWVGAPSGEMARDGAQRVLIGPQGCPGQGMIPKSSIIEMHPARGISGLIDSVAIRHVSGGVSHVKFKSYDQGREKWQSETLDFVWFDEEPPEDIYTEGLTRTNATNGFVWMTFTPLLGMSNVVMRFLRDPGPDRGDVRMEIEDALHISPEVRAAIIASYLPHEVDARTRGIPILGSGRIYPVPRALIEIEPFQIPPYWPVIAGIDFGWEHPTAAVKVAWIRTPSTSWLNMSGKKLRYWSMQPRCDRGTAYLRGHRTPCNMTRQAAIRLASCIVTKVWTCAANTHSSKTTGRTALRPASGTSSIGCKATASGCLAT
jgi:phage terminase large subunit-like protein